MEPMKGTTAVVLLALLAACGAPVAENPPAPSVGTGGPAGGSPGSPGASPDDFIPEDVPVRSAYYARPVPPAGFRAAIPWGAAIHDYRLPGASRVEVDWLRLWARVAGEDVLLAADEYDAFDPESRWFGLYARDPWFGGDAHRSMPVRYARGCLVFEPHEAPDRVWHWWATEYPRPVVPGDATRVWVEARVRVVGPALVQIGGDYWREPTSEPAGYGVNNVEIGASDWVGETGGWQVMTMGAPR